IRRNILPRRERAGLLIVGGSFTRIVQVLASLARAALAVCAKQRFEFGKQIRIWSEMTEIGIAVFLGGRLPLFHLRAVVAMKAVAFDRSRCDAFAAEYIFEGPGHRRGSGA